MPTRYFVSYLPHRFMTGGDEDGVWVAVIQANATLRTWEMSRDAYMDVSVRATQEPKPRTGCPKRPESSRTNLYCEAVPLYLS